MDDEENPIDIDVIKKDIYFHMSEEKRLKEEIPESVIVSMFKINTCEIRNTLAEKHARIAKEEIELIAKRARQQASELLDVFEKKNMKIESNPKDIEELTSIKEFMA